MRKLLTIALILGFIQANAQNYTGNSFNARGLFNSPLYKLNGVSLDSLPNASNRGFLTTWQYNKLMAGGLSSLYKEKADSINLSGYATQYDLMAAATNYWTYKAGASGKNDTLYTTNSNIGVYTSRPLASLSIGPRAELSNGLYVKSGSGPTDPYKYIAQFVSIEDYPILTVGNIIDVTVGSSLTPAPIFLVESSDSARIRLRGSGHYWTQSIKTDGNLTFRPSHIDMNVGIGNNNPEYKLDVNGTSRFGTSTNHTSTEADGTLVFTGDATVFDDIMGPFSTGQNGAAGYPPFVPDSSYYTFTLDTTSASICKIYFSIQLPHSYKEGSNIYPHIHYKQEGATTPVFKVKYKWVNAGGSINVGWKWYTMATSTGTTDKTSQLLYNANGINGTGKTVSSIIYCQVYMSAVAAGRSTTNAYQFDIHFEKDAIGSRTTLSK